MVLPKSRSKTNFRIAILYYKQNYGDCHLPLFSCILHTRILEKKTNITLFQDTRYKTQDTRHKTQDIYFAHSFNVQKNRNDYV